MSIKDWKDKELNTLLNEKWGFSMNLNKLNENKKPDFPDVDGDGDREEPISQAQKDKKAKGGDDKPKKKAKKGEIPPQLRNHVKGKKKDKEDSEEELNEISMGHGTDGRGPDVNLKQAKNKLKDVGNPPKKDKNKKKGKINEGESELEEIKAMVRQNFEGEELDDATINQIANMIKAKRDKNKPPPKSGGNSGSGAPAQASLEEQKLRQAVRRMIKKKLKR